MKINYQSSPLNSLVVTLILICCCIPVYGDSLVYQDGFETNEGYTIGDLDQQKSWQVLDGTAEVQNEVAHSGENAAKFSANSHVKNQASAIGSKVILTSYLQAPEPGSNSGSPSNGLNSSTIAGIDLDDSNHLIAFDGNGNGQGQWRNTGFSPQAGKWFEVKIVLDFDNKTWSLSANGTRLLTDLGFNNNSLISVYQLNWATDDRGDYFLDDLSLNLDTQDDEIPNIGDFTIGFEPEENFQIGNLNGQNNWIVKKGNAEIWETIVHSGVQAAHLHPDSNIEYNHPFFNGRNTVSMYLQAHATPEPNLPEISRSVLIYYDETKGIMGFNGDGMGGGEWVESGVNPAPDTWFKVDIRQDFENKVWDASIDGQKVFEDLGFYSNAILTLSQVNIHSSQENDVIVDDFQLVSSSDDTPIKVWNIY